VNLRFRILILSLSFWIGGCFEGELTTESLGLTSNNFSLKQKGTTTSDIKVNSGNNEAAFTVACGTGMTSLKISYDGATWTEIATLSCASGSHDVTYTVPVPIVTSSGTLNFPIIPFQIKSTGADVESSVLSARFVVPSFVTQLATIENGAAVTNSMTVSMNLSASLSDGSKTYSPYQVLITNTAACGSGSWQLYSTLVFGSVLAIANSTNYVYVKYRDEAGNESSCISDSIDHDGSAPTALGILINGGDAQTTSAPATLTISATADATQMYVSSTSDCSSGGTWETYATSKAWTLPGPGINLVSVKFRDSIGNVSTCISDTIIWDTTPPQTPSLLALASGVSATDNDNPVAIVVSPVIEGDTAYVYSDITCTTLLNSSVAGSGGTASVPSPLPGDGPASFWAKVIDPGGLSSSCSTATVSYTLDTGGPTVTNVTSALADGDYVTGQNIDIQVTFQEPVLVSGGTPTLALNFNGTTDQASYLSGSGTSTLTFRYTVQSTHTEDDLDYTATTALVTGGATIADSAGNAADLTLPTPGAAGSLGANKALTVNFNVVVTEIIASSGGRFFGGETVEFIVRFSGPVVVGGNPQLRIRQGAGLVSATYSSLRTTTREIVFSWSIPATLDTDGVVAELIHLPTGSDFIRNSFGANLTGLDFTDIPFSTIKTYNGTRPAPTLADSNMTFLDENAGTINLAITLAAAVPGEDVTVTYQVTPYSSATAGSDFILSSGTVTLPAGTTSVNLPITIVDDALGENPEAFTVNLVKSSHSYLGTHTSKTFMLLDNDSSTSIAKVGVGYGHLCVLYTSGRLDCWGQNAYGQVGDGTTTARYLPYTVYSSGVTDITVQQNSSCAIRAGNLFCWGDNIYYKFGLGDMSSRLSPTQVTGITDVLQFATGSYSSCALYDSVNRYVKCWGYNIYGGFGDGSATNVYRTTATAANVILSGVQLLDVATQHACAYDGANMKCWGTNSSGELGLGVTSSVELSPQTLALSGVVPSKIQLMSSASCILGTDAKVHCWGSANSYKLGNGVSTPNRTALNAALPVHTGVTSFSTNSLGSFGCLRSAGVLKCWGNNSDGFPGSSTSTLTTPTALNTPAIGEVYAGTSNACYTDSNNRHIFCGGTILNTFPTTYPNIAATPVQISSNVTKALTGDDSRCYLTTDQFLYCGSLTATYIPGDNSTTVRKYPVQSQVFPVLDFSMTSNDTVCAVRTDNTLWCWGTNSASWASMGDGTSSSRQYPVYVMSNVTKVSGGLSYFCALKTDSSLWCWGLNGTKGLIGQGENTTPSFARPQLVIASGVTDFDTGLQHTCATVSGQIYCWGDNASGQLGDASGTDQYSPKLAVDISNLAAVKVATGQAHSCASYSGGNVRCWGLGTSGQLGRGNLTSLPLAVDDSIGSGVSSVVAITHNTCALYSDSTVHCWGSGAVGLNGMGTYSNITSPSAAILSSITHLSGKTNSYSTFDRTYSFFARDAANNVFMWGYINFLAAGLDQSLGAVINLPTN
jgi:alpha-tubulin suppressor-like RCC1 family protein